MTISTTTNRVAYTGDGVSVAFTVPFLFLANSDIAVYVDGVEVTTGFTTTGAGAASGTVTFVTAPVSDALIVLVRDPDFLQSTAIPSNGPFPSTSVERMSDKAMIGVQRVSDLVGRALSIGDGEAAIDMTLPAPDDRAELLLGFASDGTILMYEPAPLTAIFTADGAAAIAAVTAGIGANGYIQGTRRQSPINIVGTGGVPISGSNVTVRDLRVNAPGSAQIIYAGAAASDVELVGLDVSSDATASPNGHGVQLNVAGSNRWKVRNGRLDVYNFGVLFNSAAGGTSGHAVVGMDITTQVGDAIEFNSPTTAMADVLVAYNILKVSAGSGTAKGFGAGFARVDGLVNVGNLVSRAWLEAYHFEDGCTNAVHVGNVAKHCQSDGIRVVMSSRGDSRAIPIVGASYEADAIIAGTAGVRIVNDSNGTVYGSPIVGVKARNFESAFWLGGDATHLLDNGVSDSCTYAVRCETGAAIDTRVKGTVLTIGVHTALLYVSSGVGAAVRAGRFICDSKPTNIILKAAPGTTRPACSVDGFSWPQTNVIAALGSWVSLFPAAASGSFEGRLSVQARNNAALVDNIDLTARLIWDGTTLTVTGARKEQNGALSLIGATAADSLRVSGGQLQINIYHLTGVTARVDVDFDGEYKV